ncbi:MAG: helix-turn-helix domain-containing protein [Nitrospinae bacterium]|nr:helix-turn-helix domain-containing protein [Nitrospinota bacterium]
MDWKKLLGLITTSVDEELRLRNAYLAVENRILRQQIPGRVSLCDSDRKALAHIGRQLGRKALAEIATIAQPDTILAWHRKFVEQPVDTSPCASVGRPRIATEVEDLVVRIARENRSWGYDRIVGALANLGYTISDQTVGNILKRYGIPPAPERKKTVPWREFIRIHMSVLGATTFFNGEIWTWFGYVISSVLFLLGLARSKITSSSIMSYLHAWWMLPWLPWFLDGPAHLGRWGYPVRKHGGLRRRLDDGRLQGPRLSICAPADDRQCHLPRIGNGMHMPAVSYGPIRDGPTRHRQGFVGLLQYYDCEAA